VRVLVDQAAQDGFSADLLSVDVGQGGAGNVRFLAGDARGDARVRPGGVGLASMRERAIEVGGECVVEDGAWDDGSHGTTVRATLPLHAHEERA